MGSDLARVSFDPGRHWQAVISQQGRVTLEADANEATAIAAARERGQLVDVVGPAGAPLGAPGTSGGYSVSAIAASSGSFTGDLALTAGTLYVGGERMVLDEPITYGDQPDWLDTAGDSLWTPVAVPTVTGDATVSELVYLLLREQEVGAVEDPALLDVALGGPDTAARSRIVQRVVRKSTTQASEQTPLQDPSLVSTWASMGLAVDSASMRLSSSARLLVSGAYSGSENQLIRVQVASVISGVPTLVWGYDNAHDLYQVTAAAGADGTATQLTLVQAPVDVYHQPAAGQTVEILESAAQLAPEDTSGYIAATTGIVTTLTPAGGYQPDTQQVQITTPVTVAPGGPPLFMRVWQDTVVYNGPGPVALGDTGLSVTLSLSGTPSSVTTYHVGDYWQFAVRPGTSTPIYPARILESPQPPGGPRMWACPLALVDWALPGSTATAPTPTVTDLRPRFDNLVDTLAALMSTDLQGRNFPLALLYLFGRGVISGCIPSISVTQPASGATAVQVTVTVTAGVLVDGRGAVVPQTGLTLTTSVPLTFSGPGTLVDTKQWLYIVTDASETPSLQLRTTSPVGALAVPSDVSTAITDPGAGPVVPPALTCSQSETAAWQMYSDVPSPQPNTDPAVCLGVIGVEGGAGWTAPDDRQQLFPTPAITAAVWQSQRQSVYAALQAACTAAPVSLQAIQLGATSLNGQSVLGATTGRKATIVLSGTVRGSAVTVTFESSAGVTVHGPIAILPGASSGTVSFDITAATGAQSITAIIAGDQLQASFTAVQMQAPTLAGGAGAVMSGDPIAVSVALSSPATEGISVTLSAPNVTVSPATIQIAQGAATGSATVTVTPPASGQIKLAGSVTSADGHAGPALPVLTFSAVSMSTLSVNPNPITIPTPATGTGTITLTGPTPYEIQISVASANQAVLTVTPSLLTVAEGATTVQTFQLTGVAVGSTTVTATRTSTAATGGQPQQLSTSVGVQPKPKESKEGKDTKDTKERKDTKEGKETGQGRRDRVGQGGAGRGVAGTGAGRGLAGDGEAEGRSFIGPSLRPAVGRGAFDEPETETDT